MAAKKTAGAPTVTAGDTRGGIVKMKFKNVKLEKITSSVAGAGGTYKRQSDGSFLVNGSDVPALMGLGLSPV